MVGHRKTGGLDPAHHMEGTPIPTHRNPNSPVRTDVIDRADRIAPLAGDDTPPTPPHALQDRHQHQYQLRLVQYPYDSHRMVGNLGHRSEHDGDYLWRIGAADRSTGRAHRHADRRTHLHPVVGRLVGVVGNTAHTVGLIVAGTEFEERAEDSRGTVEHRPPEVEHSHTLSHISEFQAVNSVQKSTDELGLLLLAEVRSSIPHIAASP